MNQKITGKILSVGDELRFESGFYKRTVIVETLDQYPQVLPIDFMKEKTTLAEGMEVGKVYEVAVDIRGHEHNGKHYVDLVGWDVKGVS